MRYLFFIFFTLLLQSCSPSLQKGGWIAVVFIAAGAVGFSISAIRKSLLIRESVFKINESAYAVALFLIAIAVYIWMNSAK